MCSFHNLNRMQMVPADGSDVENKYDKFITWLPPKEGTKQQNIYRCLWMNCGQHFEEHDEFLLHFQTHYGEIQDENQPGTSRKCSMTNCRTLLNSKENILRHAYMHYFQMCRQLDGLQTVRCRPELHNITNCEFPSSSKIGYDGKVMVCEWMNCSKIFDNIMDFISHANVHVDQARPEINNEFMCLWEGCRISFKNKANLKAHVRHHSGDKVTACPFCGAFFSNNSKLLDHILRRKIPEEGSNSCILCQKRFKSERLLREHCRRHVMVYECDTCMVTVDSPSALRRHKVAVHSKLRNFFCQICDRQFAQKADLKRHGLLHTEELQHECDQCGERFRWKKQLVTHKRKHDDDYKPFTHLCHLCDARYTTGFSLSRHLVNKHQCSVPEGFARFQYKKCSDGYARLQTKRCISLSLSSKYGRENNILLDNPTLNVNFL